MSTVQEIESAIEKLTDAQVAEIQAWLFDREIARDSARGLLDGLTEQAVSSERAI